MTEHLPSPSGTSAPGFGFGLRVIWLGLLFGVIRAGSGVTACVLGWVIKDRDSVSS